MYKRKWSLALSVIFAFMAFLTNLTITAEAQSDVSVYSRIAAGSDGHTLIVKSDGTVL